MVSINWATIPGPKYYHPADVESAIQSVVEAPVQERDPGAALRYAVGNDHAGTLYPAAVAATKRLLDVIQNRPGAPRRAALIVLIDWWGTFRPEPGYETFPDSTGATVELLPAIVNEIVAAEPLLASIPGSDPIARKPALQLLQCIKEGWVPFEF
jgi:hypothetical protein